MKKTEVRPFHLALPVTDLGDTRRFYIETLGCDVGRESSRWVDLNFFGHQVTLHLVDVAAWQQASNEVDDDAVPASHFGVILRPADWRALADRLTAADIEFIIPPKVRFEGQTGEQATMFFRDPSGNALEFKSFADDAAIFAAYASS
ncbi:MAG: VOC family protein [Pseudomonadota bacterium]